MSGLFKKIGALNDSYQIIFPKIGYLGIVSNGLQITLLQDRSFVNIFIFKCLTDDLGEKEAWRPTHFS